MCVCFVVVVVVVGCLFVFFLVWFCVCVFLLLLLLLFVCVFFFFFFFLGGGGSFCLLVQLHSLFCRDGWLPCPDPQNHTARMLLAHGNHLIQVAVLQGYGPQGRPAQPHNHTALMLLAFSIWYSLPMSVFQRWVIAMATTHRTAQR